MNECFCLQHAVYGASIARAQPSFCKESSAFPALKIYRSPLTIPRIWDKNKHEPASGCAEQSVNSPLSAFSMENHCDETELQENRTFVWFPRALFASAGAVVDAALVTRAMDNNTTWGMFVIEIQSSMWFLTVKCDYRHTLFSTLHICRFSYRNSNTGWSFLWWFEIFNLPYNSNMKLNRNFPKFCVGCETAYL